MFTLTLVTPRRKLVENAPLKEVYVPAYRGEIEILPGHAPLITTLSAGVLKYTLEGSTKEERVAVSWGYCEVTAAGAVNVLAETATTQDEINLTEAQAARASALSELGKTTYEDFEKNKKDFEEAEARIHTVQG